MGLLSFSSRHFCSMLYFAGILDEVLNRIQFDSPISAPILPSDGDHKPATHFVSKDVKVLYDTSVKKGSVSLP